MPYKKETDKKKIKENDSLRWEKKYRTYLIFFCVFQNKTAPNGFKTSNSLDVFPLKKKIMITSVVIVIQKRLKIRI